MTEHNWDQDLFDLVFHPEKAEARIKKELDDIVGEFASSGFERRLAMLPAYFDLRQAAILSCLLRELETVRKKMGIE